MMGDVKFWYVWGFESRFDSPWEGVHFAAWTKEECETWLKENYPQFVMVNDTQFAEEKILGWDKVDGGIFEAKPPRPDRPNPQDAEYHKAILLLLNK